MKWFLPFVLISFQLLAADSLKMKPGLWNVEMKIKGADGKEFDPSAKVREALANIPEAQRKKMMEMMGEMKPAMSQKTGFDVCYTKEMIEDPTALAKNAGQQGKCDSKLISQSKSEVKTQFTCKDGTTGDTSWKVGHPDSYDGIVNMKSPSRGNQTLIFKGKFLTEKCSDQKSMKKTKSDS
jgi:Protein of unknown function (DUF3617)